MADKPDSKPPPPKPTQDPGGHVKSGGDHIKPLATNDGVSKPPKDKR